MQSKLNRTSQESVANDDAVSFLQEIEIANTDPNAINGLKNTLTRCATAMPISKRTQAAVIQNIFICLLNIPHNKPLPPILDQLCYDFLKEHQAASPGDIDGMMKCFNSYTAIFTVDISYYQSDEFKEYDRTLATAANKLLRAIKKHKDKFNIDDAINSCELLWKVKKAIENPSDAENNKELNRLIHHISLGQTSWAKVITGFAMMFIGALLMLTAKSLFVASAGTAAPISILGCATGLNMMQMGTVLTGITSLVTGFGIAYSGKQTGIAATAHSFYKALCQKNASGVSATHNEAKVVTQQRSA